MSSGKMHAAEIDTDADLVRRLLAAQFPEWAEQSIERVRSPGTVNALYRIGADKVARLPLLEGDTADMDREFRWLPQLAPLLPVPVPTPIARGEPADAFPMPWSVYRWLDGESPVAGALTRPAELAGDLAGFIEAFGRIELPDGPPAYRGGPLDLLDSSTRKAIGELEGVIDTDAATAIWEHALTVGGWEGPPVWIHADLMPGNLLTREGRLCAVIDFATAGVGDPACDLIVAWNLLPATVRESFRTAVAVDDATWIRGRARALSMSLIQLPYYRHTNLSMAANSRHTIAEVLADDR